MKPDQFEESQRLTSLYSEMGEIEIRELAAGIDDLTDVAKQVLRDELKKRSLSGDASAVRSAVPRNQEWEYAEDSKDQMVAEGDDDSRAEFTWKTRLCECNTSEEAMALVLTLRKAGIDGWVEGQRSVASMNGPTVLVAADQLEQAREIAAQPIPQDIIDEMNEPPGEFVPPTCPACGAKDPTLESTDPSNTWLCESCDNTWTEPVPE
jgi:hypothetical protein